jgi:putative spermidine/putrescine transport system substrate-binding protein
MKFIDFASSAKPQADHSTAMWASPVNKKAIDMLPEDVRNQVGASSELEEIQIHRDFEWWAENFDEVSQLFQEWLLKN